MNYALVSKTYKHNFFSVSSVHFAHRMKPLVSIRQSGANANEDARLYSSESVLEDSICEGF